MSFEERLASLPGRRLEHAAIAGVLGRLALPRRWAEILTSYPAAGARLTLAEEDDESGLGAEIQLMDDGQILSEAFDVYPGIVAVTFGYVPFGVCMEGSGDPYFLRTSDGAVVRIPHDATRNNSLDESQIERVAPSAEALIAKATVE